MGIPPIRPYPMPTMTGGPAWQPDPHRAVLLIHDMQRYFVDLLPPHDSPRVELLANIGRIRRAATDAGIPVVYTAQPGRLARAQRGLLYDFWGAGMSTDERVREIVPELAPGPADVVVEKSRYSAFHDTRLAGVLTGLRRDQLLVCGVYAHIGCLATACDAFSRDIQPFLLADALADFSARDHALALEYASRTCAVVLSTDGLVTALGTEIPAPAHPLLHHAGQLHP